MTGIVAPPHGPRTGTRGPIHVLVVEDSIDHQTLMRRCLEQAGMRVDVASDANEALAVIDEVELVLLDYRLPGDTGLELLEQINDRPRPPSVIMVTGAGSTNVAVEAMRAGAIDYVAKDSGYLDDLPEVVHRAWRHHDLTQRASELQRLALLVSSARDRDTLFHEIVSGARRLLRARSCALLLEQHGRLAAATVLGEEPQDLAELEAREVSALDPDGGPILEEERLLVPLPRDGGVPLGLLAVWTEGVEHDVEELQLARAFASFVGIALRNLRQRELEQALVSELQQTVDARRDFIASVSHELRTPLTCIIGFVDTLDHGWEQMQAEARLDMLKRIGRNAGDLKVLVDELIDLAALDRGRSFKLVLETLQMDQQVRRSVDDAAEILGDREVLMELEPLAVRADESLVRRTLTNLLTNAVKFSEEGSPLRVSVVRADDDGIRIEVQDHGIGMEPQQAARVFDPFFRANPSVANAVRGSGIGLALVKEYVRTMGGRVGVQSEPGVGSTFWFTLPQAE